MLYILFFRPYRNPFMRWFMKTFSNDYKKSKKTYKWFLKKHQECRNAAISDTDGYYKFFEFLIENEELFPLRGKAKEFEKMMQGKSSDDIGTVNELIKKGSIPSKNMETFVHFSGSGRNWHKIWIQYSFQGTIWLMFISLQYMEEKGRDSCMYVIEETKFDDDSNDGRGRRKDFPDGPHHGNGINPTVVRKRKVVLN